jgi:RHS repeat-associated protein
MNSINVNAIAYRPWSVVSTALASLALCCAGVAHAQGTPVSNPYDQTRTSSFTYFGSSDGAKNGLLRSEIVEPLTSATPNPQLCVVTTYDYDAYGNKVSASAANCVGATGNAVFATRGSSSAYAVQTVSVAGTGVSIPAGAFATTAANVLAQSESHAFDPRFGAMTSLTGPNGLTTSWVIDDLGRKASEVRADGTSTVSSYCFIAGRVSDTSTNSSGCSALSPSASEIPADAIAFVHSEPHDTAGNKSGPFARAYTDRAGRTIRSVTEAFDGASQPGGISRLIVQDTDYSPYGPQTVVTQPYFLDTGVSSSTGSTAYGMSLTAYDVLGRPMAAYIADGNGSQGSVAFGSRGSRQAAMTTFVYAGLTTTITDDKGQTRVEEKNIDGKLVRATDALGAQVAYQHDAFGNLVITKDALQNQVIVSYDARGRKVAMSDPDTGTWKYDYDAMGQLVWQQSANQLALGWSTTMIYDVLGRMIQRSEHEYVSTWSYDKYAADSDLAHSTCAKGVGKLCESNATNGVNRKIAYDGFGRPINARTTVASGPSFATAVTYDAVTGRRNSQTYPTGLQVAYGYTPKGFPSQLTLVTAATVTPLPATAGGSTGAPVPVNSVLWSAIAYNAWGKPEQQTYGNGVTTTAGFDATTGRLSTLQAGASNAVLNQSFVWNSLGQLTQRGDSNGDGSTGAVTDSFQYDSIGRLQSYTVSAPAIPNLSRAVSLQYNALGMLLYKSDVGNYAYGAQNTANVKPHALSSITGAVSGGYTYDANGNLKTATTGAYRQIDYTSFDLPDNNNGAQGPSGGPQYLWQYDENHQRIKETHIGGGVTRTTWYAHPDNQGGLAFESESSSANPTPMNRHYLSVGGSAIGVLVSNAALPTLAAGAMAPPGLLNITLLKVEYWHKDHLGSLITTTDHTGAVTQRYAYDPFGKRRYTTGNYDASGALVIDWTSNTNNGTDRGYTGHEQLDDIGIVHMNGRLFDATLGRFLQGDPLIQDPSNLQNYNRYGYCFNNPMTCSDPSGLGFASLLKWLDPLGYAAHKAMTHSAVGRAFIQWEIYVGSSWCGPWAAACYGAGEAINASLSGYSDSQAFRIGLVSGATAYANDYVGSNYSGFENVAAHAVVGCASAAASGGSCRSGAVGAAVGSAYDNATGLHYTGEGAGVVNFVVSSSVGGLASLASGGTFADGAKQAAYSYLFNFLGHVHRYLSMHGAATANLGLTYGEIEQFGEMVRGVDALPGSQDPEMSRMHGMCMAGESPGDCGRITARYIDNLWEEKSVDALAKLVHLDQDSYAPKHAGGQPYSGFGLSNLGEAVAHGWSDRMPDSSVSDMLIRRTQTLIRDYNEYCGGCVKSGLKKGP